MTRRSRARVALPRGYRTRFTVAEERVTVGREDFVLAHPADAEALISVEDFDRDERLPYWADLWPSAFALGESLLAAGAPRDKRRAIELGCGIGLVACCAVRAGFELTVTDYYDEAVAFTAANVLANTGARVSAHHLDWRAIPEDLGRFDLVLAADVLYERAYGPLVARVIDRLLVPGGRAWVADPGRVGAEQFVDEAKLLGARVTSHTHCLTLVGREHEITRYELTVPTAR
ncbi:MAG: methyltransferase domain-containing protein [Gemmatimonadaceae bacterium]